MENNKIKYLQLSDNYHVLDTSCDNSVLNYIRNEFMRDGVFRTCKINKKQCVKDLGVSCNEK